MEPIRTAISIAVAEETQIAAARRATAEFCRRMGLSDQLIARAELIAVELAGNILNHAERGSLYVTPVPGRPYSVQLIAADRGPGIPDTQQALEDGFSTHTTPGLGLGAVRRKSEALDIYSSRTGGTIVAATLSESTSDPEAATAVLCTHIEGETLNGDSWAQYELRDRMVWLMIDGLGHGHYASQAAQTALLVANRAFETDPGISLAALIQRMHAPMQATRGAAVLLVSASDLGNEVVCCGIGNISAVLCAGNGTTQNLVSHNGTVGHRMARVQEFRYACGAGSLLILQADGVSTKWRLSQYPGLFDRSPATIAGVLYRDAARGRDDATVMVSRLWTRMPAGSEANPAGDKTLG